MKIKYWLDSGANIHSCRKGEVDLERDAGITDEEKDDVMRDFAFARLDWGYEEAE